MKVFKILIVNIALSISIVCFAGPDRSYSPGWKRTKIEGVGNVYICYPKYEIIKGEMVAVYPKTVDNESKDLKDYIDQQERKRLRANSNAASQSVKVVDNPVAMKHKLGLQQPAVENNAQQKTSESSMQHVRPIGHPVQEHPVRNTVEINSYFGKQLINAAHDGDFSTIMDCIFIKRVPINHRDAELGITPVAAAIKAERVSLACRLIVWGANPLIEDNQQKNALDHCSSDEIRRCVIKAVEVYNSKHNSNRISAGCKPIDRDKSCDSNSHTITNGLQDISNSFDDTGSH